MNKYNFLLQQLIAASFITLFLLQTGAVHKILKQWTMPIQFNLFTTQFIWKPSVKSLKSTRMLPNIKPRPIWAETQVYEMSATKS